MRAYDVLGGGPAPRGRGGGGAPPPGKLKANPLRRSPSLTKSDEVPVETGHDII